MKHNRFVLYLLGLVLLAITFSAQAAKGTSPRGGVDVMRIKVDLVVHKMNAVKTGVIGARDQVTVSVTVKAGSASSSARVCSGPFKVRVDWSDDPTVGWERLGEAGVATMCTGGAMAKIPMVTRRFVDVDGVPRGTGRKYRATVDYDNRVDESNEGNNVTGVGYFHP